MKVGFLPKVFLTVILAAVFTFSFSFSAMACPGDRFKNPFPDGLPDPPIVYQTKPVSELPESGMMCLTFDDGFSKEGIIRILDCLKKAQVKCTFFVIGSRCLKPYPDLWKRAAAEGHEIAYHTTTHTSLTSKSDEWIKNDILAWEKIAKEVLGEDYVIPKIARLPGGAGDRTKRILKCFNEMGYTVIRWSADTLSGLGGTKGNYRFPKKVAQYVLNHAKVGAIMLQHFNSYDDKSVSFYIQELKTKYKLGKVTEALEEAGYYGKERKADWEKWKKWKEREERRSRYPFCFYSCFPRAPYQGLFYFSMISLKRRTNSLRLNFSAVFAILCGLKVRLSNFRTAFISAFSDCSLIKRPFISGIIISFAPAEL